MPSAEQMCDSGDVEPQPVSVDLDKRRPAACPARQPLYQRCIPFGIGRNGDQRRVERACIGQPRASAGPALGGGFRDGMNDRTVRSLDGKDDWIVRR